MATPTRDDPDTTPQRVVIVSRFERNVARLHVKVTRMLGETPSPAIKAIAEAKSR